MLIIFHMGEVVMYRKSMNIFSIWEEAVIKNNAFCFYLELKVKLLIGCEFRALDLTVSLKAWIKSKVFACH